MLYEVITNMELSDSPNICHESKESRPYNMLDLRLRISESKFLISLELISRITSYNVCYTKLLRYHLQYRIGCMPRMKRYFRYVKQCIYFYNHFHLFRILK